MRAVNLLPREATRQRRSLAQQNTATLVGAGLGVFVTGALAIGFLHETSAVSSAQKQLQAAKAELASTPRPAQVVVQPDPNAALAGEQSARVTAVSTAIGGRLAWDRILRELSLVLPDDVTLTSLTLTTPVTTGAAPGTASNDLTIAGQTYSHDSVARLLARLALIPELSQVSLQSDTSSLTGAGGSGQPAAAGPVSVAPVSFTIVASLKVPPGLAGLTALPSAPTPPVSTDTTTGTTTP